MTLNYSPVKDIFWESGYWPSWESVYHSARGSVWRSVRSSVYDSVNFVVNLELHSNDFVSYHPVVEDLN